MYVNVWFLTSCLNSAVSLTGVKELSINIIIDFSYVLLTPVGCHTVGTLLWGSSFSESRHSSCHVALKSVKKTQKQIIDQIPSPNLFRKKKGSNTHTHTHRYARAHTHTCSNQMKRIETHTKQNKSEKSSCLKPLLFGIHVGPQNERQGKTVASIHE